MSYKVNNTIRIKDDNNVVFKDIIATSHETFPTGGDKGTVSGYSSGGYTGSVRTTTIDKYPFSSDGNATDVGDLLALVTLGAGQSSSTNGYYSGGLTGPSTVTDTIQKFPFSVDAGSSDVGNLSAQPSNGRAEVTGQSSGEHGYTSGGASGAPLFDTIDKFAFAADGNATDVGNLTQARSSLSGQSSDASGYNSGGYRPAGPPNGVNTIDKFPFSSDANATDVGNLATVCVDVAGQNSSTSGYISGGSDGTPVPDILNVIQKFPFAADAGSSDVGDLTVGRKFIGGVSSGQSGYTNGGFSPTPTTNYNVIDKFSFSSDANATDVGNLTQIRNGIAGQQV